MDELCQLLLDEFFLPGPDYFSTVLPLCGSKTADHYPWVYPLEPHQPWVYTQGTPRQRLLDGKFYYHQ